MHRILLVTGLVCTLTLTPLAASARTATFLETFPREQMTCGKRGWTFPGLIGGRTPLTACILRYRNNTGKSPFGPL